MGLKVRKLKQAERRLMEETDFNATAIRRRTI